MQSFILIMAVQMFNVNFLSLYDMVRDKAEAVRYLQQLGILHSRRECANGHEMRLHLSDKEDRWRCQRLGCNQQIQLKSGTSLKGTHLSYKQAVLFIYSWAHEMTSMKFCERELDISMVTAVNWNNYLREVCAFQLLQNPVVIGGVGLNVEID